MNFKLTYISHSGFYIETNDKYGILIDPYIKNNPSSNYNWKEKNITDIFVTHGHNDHLGDTIEISKEKNAKITCIFELANYCKKNGARNINGVNIGGKIKFPYGNVWFFNAHHSSSSINGEYLGLACSILFEIGNIKILHLGDTGLHIDMKIIGEIYKPDIVLTPIGGYFTMGIDEAVIANKFLNSKIVIPMHYNTFDLIKVNVKEFYEKINKNNQKCIIMEKNESIEF